MGKQRYLWNPHAKGQVLRHFWSNSVEKWKSLPFCTNHLSILWKQVSVCPSVCVSVCSNTIYSPILCLIQSTRIFLETACQGKGFKTIFSFVFEKLNKKLLESTFFKTLIFWPFYLTMIYTTSSFVQTLSTPPFFSQFNQQGYFWKIQSKTKVLKPILAEYFKKLNKWKYLKIFIFSNLALVI